MAFNQIFKYFSVTVTLLALTLGVVARFYGIGTSPLAIDEYYIAQAVKNILSHGLPSFMCGGFYTRGLVLQYTAAALTIFGADIEEALRLVAVLFNLLAVPAIVLLSRRMGSLYLAAGAVLLFALSIWEIEYARFGRMYAPFQAAFLWYCVALSYAYLGSMRAFVLSLLLGTMSVLIYEGAIFLLVLSFVPLVAGRIRGLGAWVAAATTTLFGFSFIDYDFGALGARQTLPAALRTDSAGYWSLPIDYPPTLDILGGGGPMVILGTAVTIGLVGFILYREFRRDKSRTEELTWMGSAWLVFIVILAGLGLFGSILALSLVGMIWGWFRIQELDRQALSVTLVTIIVAGIIWTAVSLAESSGSTVSRLVSTVKLLFLYPDIYSEVIYRWIRSLPVFSLIAVSSISAAMTIIMHHRHKSVVEDKLYLFFTGLTLLLVYAVAILPQMYSTIRYTYFLHPLVIILTIQAWSIIGRHFLQRALPEYTEGVIIGVMTALVLVTSTDYSLGHIRNITRPDVMYRLNMNKWQVDRVYRRWDYRSPAVYVNTHATTGDIVLTTSQSVPFYLDRLTHFYANSDGREFNNIAICEGEQERWSGATLVYTPSSLDSLLKTRGTRRVWAILRAADRKEASPEERALVSTYKNDQVFASQDGRLIVLRIDADSTSPAAMQNQTAEDLN